MSWGVQIFGPKQFLIHLRFGLVHQELFLHLQIILKTHFGGEVLTHEQLGVAVEAEDYLILSFLLYNIYSYVFLIFLHVEVKLNFLF